MSFDTASSFSKFNKKLNIAITSSYNDFADNLDFKETSFLDTLQIGIFQVAVTELSQILNHKRSL